MLVAGAYLALALAEGGFATELVAALTIALWWAIIIGLLVRAWPGSQPPRAAVVTGSFLAGLAALGGLSMLWAGDAGRAFEDTVTTLGYLGLFVLVVVSSPRGSARGWLVGLAVGIAAVALVALATRFEPGLLGDADRELAEAIPTALGRLSYPIGYWNALAAVMAIGAILLAWLGVAARSRAARASFLAAAVLPAFVIFLSQSRGGALAMAAGAIVLVALAPQRIGLGAGALLVATGTAILALIGSARDDFIDGLATATAESQGLEMALATFAVVATTAGLWYAVEGRLRALRLPSAPALRRAAAVGAAVLLVAAIVVADPAERIGEFADAGEYTATASAQPSEQPAALQGSGRYQFWSIALDAFQSEPATGIGAGNYELFWNANNPIPAVVEHAHSLYLEALAELGVPGLLLIVGFFAAAVAAGVLRNTRWPGGEAAVAAAVLVAGAATAALEWSWQIPAAFAPLIIAAGVLTGPGTLPRSRPQAVGPGRRRGLWERFGMASGPRERFGLGVATILAGLVAIWAAGMVLLTEVQLEASRDAVVEGDLDQAASEARDAAAIQPWSPEPYLQLAQVQELRADDEAALDAIGNAIDRAPGDWRLWLVRARIQHRPGFVEDSNAALNRANELSPLHIPSAIPPEG